VLTRLPPHLSDDVASVITLVAPKPAYKALAPKLA
jgi:hypothetical protein